MTAIGYPFGRTLDLAAPSPDTSPAPTVTAGALSAVRRDAGDRPRYLQTSAAINAGSSGGPLVDAEGYGAGIVNLKLDDASNIGFAVPINLAKALLISLGPDSKMPVPLPRSAAPSTPSTRRCVSLGRQVSRTSRAAACRCGAKPACRG